MRSTDPGLDQGPITGAMALERRVVQVQVAKVPPGVCDGGEARKESSVIKNANPEAS